MLAALPRWAVCSNKLGAYASEELDRFGWEPDVALFALAGWNARAVAAEGDLVLSAPGDVLRLVGRT